MEKANLIMRKRMDNEDYNTIREKTEEQPKSGSGYELAFLTYSKPRTQATVTQGHIYRKSSLTTVYIPTKKEIILGLTKRDI